MMPNIDPRALKSMMDRMGIHSEELEARRVVIECEGKDIVIDNPSVTLIEAQGSRSFQVAGDAREVKKEVHAEISEDDVNMVMEKTGAGKEEAREALNASGGNIAEAILNLKGDAGQV
jgi:nascent polypeptide-associated complex subunit alpha